MTTTTFNDPDSGTQLTGDVVRETYVNDQAWLIVDVDGVQWAVPIGWPNNALPVCEETDPAEYYAITMR